uniref:RNA helicase n=1 Tax=Syphacia muris TaxID=451379 RepID=A0A0N5AIH9_9BILA
MKFEEIVEFCRTDDVKSSKEFASLMLSQYSLQALAKNGYMSPSPVQVQAIPIGLLGFDVVVQAKSGTGKTLVFSLLALEGLNAQANHSQVLILAPTREIALQISSVITRLAPRVVRIGAFVGGDKSIKEDIALLKKGVHIVVGTSGRLCHLVSIKALKVDHILIFNSAKCQCIVYANDQIKCQKIYEELLKEKFDVALISSAVNQSERNNVIKLLKNFNVKVLVSTDLTARGIDAENVNIIINMGVPTDCETYLHRIGRAGRFGGYGAAFTILASRKEVRKFSAFVKEGSLRVRFLDSRDSFPPTLCQDEAFYNSCAEFIVSFFFSKYLQNILRQFLVSEEERRSNCSKPHVCSNLELKETKRYSREEMMNIRNNYSLADWTGYALNCFDSHFFNAPFVSEALLKCRKLNDPHTLDTSEASNDCKACDSSAKRKLGNFKFRRSTAKRNVYSKERLMRICQSRSKKEWYNSATTLFNMSMEPFVVPCTSDINSVHL